MAELRPVRAFSIEKVRNLWPNANTALKDASAPAQFVSAPRRFDAAYDCGLSCALLVLECNKLEIAGQGHHRVKRSATWSRHCGSRVLSQTLYQSWCRPGIPFATMRRQSSMKGSWRAPWNGRSECWPKPKAGRRNTSLWH